MFLDFTNWPVSNNLNLLEVFFLVNSFYSLKYTRTPIFSNVGIRNLPKIYLLLPWPLLHLRS